MLARRAALGLAAVAALLLPASLAGAQEVPAPEQELPEEATGSWAGTRISNTPDDAGSAIAGAVSFAHWTRPMERDRRFLVTLQLDTVGTAADACPGGSLGATELDVAATRSGDTFTGAFAEQVTAPCNGRYRVTATIRPAWLPQTQAQVATTAVVERPAAAPTAATARRDDEGRVALSWTPSAGQPADFAGYQVLRLDGGEVVDTVDLGGDQTSLEDDTAGAEPGTEIEYRVRSLRHGPNGVVASEPASTSVTVPLPGEPGDPDGADPTTPSTVGGEAGSGSRSAGAPRVNRPSVGSRGPSVPSLPRVTPPTTIDTGYDEALPFDDDDRMYGPRDAVLPEDAASLIFDDDRGDGAGILTPAAAAAVLAVWAMHLRYLGRLAREP